MTVIVPRQLELSHVTTRQSFENLFKRQKKRQSSNMTTNIWTVYAAVSITVVSVTTAEVYTTASNLEVTGRRCHICHHHYYSMDRTRPWVTWVKVSHSNKTGHFGDVLSSQSLGLILKKLNPTQQKQATQKLVPYGDWRSTSARAD